MSSISAIRLITLAVMAGFSVFQNSCSYGRNIRFILPDGYIGRFEIVLDEVDGLDVQFENDRYTYEIPASGVLRVKSFEPFEDWHKLTAAYRTGKSIPTEYEDDSSSIALRSLSGSGSRNIGGENVGPIILGYAIGTEEQSRKLLNEELT